MGTVAKLCSPSLVVYTYIRKQRRSKDNNAAMTLELAGRSWLAVAGWLGIAIARFLPASLVLSLSPPSLFLSTLPLHLGHSFFYCISSSSSFETPPTMAGPVTPLNYSFGGRAPFDRREIWWWVDDNLSVPFACRSAIRIAIHTYARTLKRDLDNWHFLVRSKSYPNRKFLIWKVRNPRTIFGQF